LQKRLLQCACLAVSIAIALTTQSQSAHMILIVAGLFWLAFPVFSNSKTAQLALITSVSLGIILSPWLVQLLYSTLAGEVHTLPWFADAYAADRLEIWDFVARKALENPLYGFGIEATRHIKNFDTAMLYTPLDHVLHPHNAVLQIWIEFGAIGALGLCVAVTAILRHIFKLDKQAGPVCLAAFMAGFVAACISYGLWQGWWLGLFSLLAALCGHLARNSKKAAL
jgi:O-antigen ligase